MICLTQSYQQAGIKNISPCGATRIFYTTKEETGSPIVTYKVQELAQTLYPKIDYMLNCKFEFDVQDGTWSVWMTGDLYVTNVTEDKHNVS